MKFLSLVPVGLIFLAVGALLFTAIDSPSREVYKCLAPDGCRAVLMAEYREGTVYPPAPITLVLSKEQSEQLQGRDLFKFAKGRYEDLRFSQASCKEREDTLNRWVALELSEVTDTAVDPNFDGVTIC